MKFIGIYTELDNLYSSIQEHIELDNELFQEFSFFDQLEYSTQDLSKQTSDLFLFQLVNNIILEYSHNQLVKNEMIGLCRQYYQDNLNNLKLIDEFEHEYHSNKVIQWFLKRSFPYKMIKKALQTKDMDQLNTLRYFMSDLIQCFVSQPHNTIQYEKENLIVYRGIKLSKEQLDEFRKNQGKLLLNNGFLTVTQSRSNALNFARESTQQINVVAAILEIECKSKDFGKSIIFTDRDKSKGLSNQDDVIFNLNVTFHLDKVEFYENIWIIKLSTSNEGEIILEKYINDTRQQTGNLNIELIFGRLMLDMGQWNQSQKYFERLLIDSNDKNQAWIEYSLEQIELDDELFQIFSFFDQLEYSTQDLSKQTSDIFWFQLFNTIILQSTYNQLAKNEMIDLCHQYYQDNIKNIKLIDEFEYEYRSDKVIQWYLKRSFPYKMIKKALKIKDMDQLNVLRYFIVDLIRSFIPRDQNRIQYEKENLTVYRSIKLSKEQLDEFKTNEGKLLLSNGFLTATPFRSNALNFARKSIKPTNFVAAILEIKCNSQDFDKNMIFTGINKCNEFSSQEDILFNLDVTFHLNNIEFHENVWIIKMTTSNEGKYILKQYIENTRQQTENLSMEIIFGRLMLDMGQWDQSQKYFERLLIESNSIDQAWIEHSLGEIHHLKREWIVARKYYDQAYDRMMKPKQMRIKDSARILSDIGEVLFAEGKYEEAMDFHERALKIRKEYFPSDHMHIATSLKNIGDIFRVQEKSDEAFTYFQEALAILEKYYNCSHIDIAMCWVCIGLCFREQRNYNKALDFHQQAIAIYEKYYPFGHISIALTLNNMADILNRQDKYDEAINIHHRALAMEKKRYPVDYMITSYNLCTIG
ncbi:unnamed protein product [Rotaria sp. Silwood1]|nr:unnamed protein product [Rotaria sp. Silwood1]